MTDDSVSDLHAAVRRRALDETLASLRLDGLKMSPRAEALFERAAAGEITTAQLEEELDRLPS